MGLDANYLKMKTPSVKIKQYSLASITTTKMEQLYQLLRKFIILNKKTLLLFDWLEIHFIDNKCVEHEGVIVIRYLYR